MHTHLFSAQYFTALAKILSGFKTPLVFTEHSTSDRRFSKKRFRLIDSWIYNNYTKIISITDEINRAVIKHTGISVNKTRIIKNGINLEKFISAAPQHKSSINSELKEEDYIIIQISSFRYPKDQPTVIKSLLYLPDNIKLVLVGDGVERIKTENLVQELGLTHRVLFLGVRTDIPSLLKTADVSILSTHYEGFGLVAVEGMASGKPFIGTNVPGLREVVKDAGILFPQGDYHKLAEEILKLMNDKEHYNRVAARCVERASKYDIDTMVDKMTSTKLIRITTVPVSLKTLLKGQHRFMSENGYEVVGVSSVGKELHEVHETEGIRVVALEMTRTISLFKDLKALWIFYRLCKKEKPVIVHSHTPKAGIVGMLGAKLACVPIRLHTVAGLPLMEAIGIKRRVLYLVERLTYFCANMVYPNSVGLYDFILYNRFTTKEKLKIIANGSSNGIDTFFFATEQITKEQQNQLKGELNLSESDFVFVFVGRLVKDKGINELVSAFSKLKSQNTKLLIVGPLEQELDPLLPETINEIHFNRNIISVGWQSDVRPYFAIADALVFPSYREGFPNVVMQAGAMGLPSIVTDINGCNEIIIDKENGIIIPPKDEKKLFEAMLLFLDNPEEVKRMANNSRKMIIDRYEQRVVWDALLKEYRRLEKELLKS